MRQLLNKKYAILFTIALSFFLLPSNAYAFEWFDVTFGTLTKIIIWPLELIVLPLSASLMALAGSVMDQTIQFGLHTAYIFSLSPAINLGWVIVRDIANIFFIFILIYISLGTIVQGAKFGTKQLLTQVIIAALLINFSLFITKAVVDVSNIFGNWLYNGVQKTLQVNSIDPNKPTSLSGLIATRMGVLDIWTKATPNTNNTGALLSYGPSSSITGIFLRITIVLTVTYIFLYSAILFISRSITILFLMVFSPVGFMGGVLPQLKKYAGQWRDELLGAAMFPIAFLLMLYISLQFINSLKVLTAGALQDKSLKLFGISISISEYFQYFLIIFLLIATLRIAKENSGELGKMLGGAADSLGKLAVNAGIGLGVGSIAVAGRSIAAAGFADKGKRLAAFGESIRESTPLLKAVMTGPGFTEKMKGVAKKGSYDVRNLKIGAVGGPTLAELTKSATGYDVGKTGNVLGFNTEQRTSKEISDDRKKWDEELKVDKAQKTILEDMKDLIEAQNKLKEAELSGVATRIDAARAGVEATKVNMEISGADSRIKSKLVDLSNKQLEKLGAKITTNEHAVGLMDSSQIKHLKDNSELSDADKGKVWAARIKKVSDAFAGRLPPGVSRADAIEDGLKQLGDTEVAELTPLMLRDPDVVRLLTPGQLGKIAQNLSRKDRQDIRDAIERLPAGVADKAKGWLASPTGAGAQF